MERNWITPVLTSRYRYRSCGGTLRARSARSTARLSPLFAAAVYTIAPARRTVYDDLRPGGSFTLHGKRQRVAAWRIGSSLSHRVISLVVLAINLSGSREEMMSSHQDTKARKGGHKTDPIQTTRRISRDTLTSSTQPPRPITTTPVTQRGKTTVITHSQEQLAPKKLFLMHVKRCLYCATTREYPEKAMGLGL